jgi:hypothetical protein
MSDKSDTIEHWVQIQQTTVDGMVAEIERLRFALAFYADERRYLGANQWCPDETDAYQPEGLGYRLDVTRDYGNIARKALNHDGPANQTTICKICDGSGLIDPMLPAHDPANGLCETCHGLGSAPQTTAFGVCNECKGIGVLAGHTCSVCEGSGRLVNFQAIRRVQEWLGDEREAGRLIFAVSDAWIAQLLKIAENGH